MLANATLTLHTFLIFLKKGKDAGKCHFDLEGTFWSNKVKDAGKYHFDLEGFFAFFKKVKDAGKCHFDLEGTF